METDLQAEVTRLTEEVKRLTAALEGRQSVIGGMMMEKYAQPRQAVAAAILSLRPDPCQYGIHSQQMAFAAGHKLAREAAARLVAVSGPSHAVGGSIADESLIELLYSLRPNFGDIGSRDVDVAAKRAKIETAIERLANGGASSLRAEPASQQDAPAVVLTDAQIARGARRLSDQSAASCNVDADDNWKIYGDDYLAEFRDAFEFAIAQQKNGGAK